MCIRILRNLCLLVCTYDLATDTDETHFRAFAAGEILVAGEISPDEDGSSVVELVGLGYVEFPRGSWEEYEERVFRFFVDRDHLN